jgi:hypothetical protein
MQFDPIRNPQFRRRWGPPPEKEAARCAPARASEPDLLNNTTTASRSRTGQKTQGRVSAHVLQLGRDFLAPRRGGR